MSITMTFDHARRRLFVKAEGPITLDHIRAHIEEERLGAGLSYSELMDVRGCSPAISADEVRMLVQLLRRLGEKSHLGPTAVIVDTDFAYGMLRMLEILIDDVCHIRPFRKEKEAEQWLATFPDSV
jgi:hypothetical protein